MHKILMSIVLCFFWGGGPPKDFGCGLGRIVFLDEMNVELLCWACDWLSGKLVFFLLSSGHTDLRGGGLIYMVMCTLGYPDGQTGARKLNGAYLNNNMVDDKRVEK